MATSANEIRLILLDLVGTARQPRLAGLGSAEWARLDAMAAQHRLQPLLHAQHGDAAAIPADLRAIWREAYRAQAITVLAQTAELIETAALLEAAGLAPIALKGAWLARHAYPQAAQRPLRDLDLLLTPDTAEAGFALLQDRGFTLAAPPEMALADILRLDKHMPPLIGPRGTLIELHHRLWEPEGRLDHASPAARDEGVRARSRVLDDGIRYPAAEDMLAHLIVHAAYSHRFDCGPLLLADLDHLLARETIDWPQFWARAAAEGWRGGARLVLDLVADYRAGARIAFTPEAGPPSPANLRADAAQLLLQDMDSRASAAVAATALKGGTAGLVQRLGGRRTAAGEGSVQREMDTEGGALGWAWSRLRRTLGDLSRGDVRGQSRRMAQLSRWLDQ